MHRSTRRHGSQFRRQLCIQTKVQHVTQAKQNMAAATADISRWSASHRLKLNPHKSEANLARDATTTGQAQPGGQDTTAP